MIYIWLQRKKAQELQNGLKGLKLPVPSTLSTAKSRNSEALTLRTAGRKAEYRHNPYHDPATGRFTSGGGGSSNAPITNFAKVMDIFDDYGVTANAPVTAEQIIDDLNKSEIGREYLKIAENLPELIQLDRESYKPELYGDNNGNSIVIYMRSNPTPERAAMAAGKTVIYYGDFSGLAVKLSEDASINVLREKYATQHAVGVYAYMEMDAKIENAQKIACLKMAG